MRLLRVRSCIALDLSEASADCELTSWPEEGSRSRLVTSSLWLRLLSSVIREAATKDAADDLSLMIILPEWSSETLADLVALLHTGRSAAGPLARAAALQELLSALGIRLDGLELSPPPPLGRLAASSSNICSSSRPEASNSGTSSRPEASNSSTSSRPEASSERLGPLCPDGPCVQPAATSITAPQFQRGQTRRGAQETSESAGAAVTVAADESVTVDAAAGGGLKRADRNFDACGSEAVSVDGDEHAAEVGEYAAAANGVGGATVCKGGGVKRTGTAKRKSTDQANVNYQEAIKILRCGVCEVRVTTSFYPALRQHYEQAHATATGGYHCPICRKTIVSTNSFHAHMHIVHREASLACSHPGCAKRFKAEASRRNHELRWHSDLRPLTCSLCGEGVSSAQHLESHLRLHRSTSVCETCGKRFLSASHLDKHRVVHTNTRPFMCETCGKTFRDAYSVKECEKRHKGTFTPKPSQQIPWRNREAKYVCDLCGYRTKGKAALERHLRGKHSPSRPFSCSLCRRSFKSKSNLESHVLVHTRGGETSAGSK